MQPPSEPAVLAMHEPDHLVLRLEGFEGPLDLLLDLARSQKIDLARISILSLVEQDLAVIESARRIRLELAADWLVMAAWLTWLKSRLLLPPGTEAAEEGEQAAEVLTARLRDLQIIRAAAGWLGDRPQLGHDVFARASPEDLTETDRSLWRSIFPRWCGRISRRCAVRRASAATPRRRRRCGASRTRCNGWGHWWAACPIGQVLSGSFHPSWVSPLERRAALASTLLAGLEMARGGAVRLRQEHDFGPILVRRNREAREDA